MFASEVEFRMAKNLEVLYKKIILYEQWDPIL